jgi:hypothetical protein
MFGAYEVEDGTVHWHQLHASEMGGNFTYTIKIFSKAVEPKKPPAFGPLSTSSLLRRIEDPTKCIFYVIFQLTEYLLL